MLAVSSQRISLCKLIRLVFTENSEYIPERARHLRVSSWTARVSTKKYILVSVQLSWFLYYLPCICMLHDFWKTRDSQYYGLRIGYGLRWKKWYSHFRPTYSNCLTYYCIAITFVASSARVPQKIEKIMNYYIPGRQDHDLIPDFYF